MRALNPIEHSFTLIDQFYPFVASCVLKVSRGPGLDSLRASLGRLQGLHPLLNVHIRERDGGFCFETDEEAVPVPLSLISRKDDSHWEDIVRHELNTGFKEEACPLMRVNYLLSPGEQEDAEIIISFHHAIVDAGIIMRMADELLSFASEIESRQKDTTELLPYPLAPDLLELLPPSYRGIRFWFRLIPFMFKQVQDEIGYRRANKGVPDSKIPDSSENDVVMLAFSREETNALIRWSRSRRISINGILSAAMLIITNQRNYAGRKKRLRTLQFGNLRPYLHPSLQEGEGGSFVSMMRYTIPLQADSHVDTIASIIDKQSLMSSRRGDRFLYALISKFLIRKTIRDHNARLGATALSYLGPVSMKQSYGQTQLREIHGYISNNCLGAELTGFAKIFSGELSIDLNFLTAELSRDEALETAHEIKQLILRSIK